MYRTRDGRKAFISHVKDGGEYPVAGVIPGQRDTSLWMKDGKSWDKDTNHPFDLIGPWEEIDTSRGCVLADDKKRIFRQYACAALTGLLAGNQLPPMDNGVHRAIELAKQMMEEEAKL
jgi:hypothetical protein